MFLKSFSFRIFLADFHEFCLFSILFLCSQLQGTVSEGKVATGTEMLLGPMADGSFSKVTITSIHRQRVPGRS
jgi:GTPase